MTRYDTAMKAATQLLCTCGACKRSLYLWFILCLHCKSSCKETWAKVFPNLAALRNQWNERTCLWRTADISYFSAPTSLTYFWPSWVSQLHFRRRTSLYLNPVEMSGSLKLWALWKEVILYHVFHGRQGTYSSLTQNKAYFYDKNKSYLRQAWETKT